MIEIHSHILPGVDDGSESIEDSMAIVDDMINNDVKGAIATPHHLNGYDENPFDKILDLTEKLNEEIKNRGIDFIIYPGQEVRVNSDLPELIDSGNIHGIAGSRYLLLELPSRSFPMYMTELLYRLIVMDYVPIIAHPERNSALADDVDLLEELIGMGCLSQVTSASLLSSNKKLRSVSERMIEEGLVAFISSDTHGVERRNSRIKDAMKRIELLYGEDLAKYFYDNSYKLVKNERVSKYSGEIKKKSLLKRIFR